MTLRNSVTIFVVLVLGLFLALAVSLVQTSNVLDRSSRDLAIAGEQIRLAEELKSSVLIHNRNAFLYVLNREPEHRAARQDQRLEVLNILRTMNTLSNSREEDRVLAEVAAQTQRYLERRRQVSASALPAAEQYIRISQDVDRTLDVVDRLIHLNSLQMRELMTAINSRKQRAELTAGVLLFTGGIILGGLIGAIFLFAARPLARLARAFASYGGGDTTARAKAEGLREIRDIASSFNGMADRLELRRQEQLQFIASIAHDLRNPLHSIALVSELLVYKIPKKEQELARVVLRQVTNLDGLVQDLIDTSRIEAGKLDLHVGEHDLAEVVRDAVELYRGGAHLHEIILELPSEPIVCRYDRSRLSQVLNNLLSNAIKYSPSGGVVRVKARREGEQARVSVSDQGIGIAAADLGNIFKPFHRTAATRETIPGIGLGLSASRRIIEAHGGVLAVESVLAKGSTFHIIVPCEGPEMPPKEVEKAG